MPTVLRSTLAARDLVEIWQYVARENRTAADHLIDSVAEKCCLLVSAPDLGQKRPELGPGLRSFVAGNYVIFYRPIKDGIELARVICFEAAHHSGHTLKVDLVGGILGLVVVG